MNKLVGETLMEVIVKASPYLREIFNTELFVSITDTKKVIAHVPGEKIDTGAQVGDWIAEGASSSQAMRSREKVIVNIPKEVYGIPYRAHATPVFDDKNNIIGAVVLGISTEKQVKFQEIIEEFGMAFAQNNLTIQEISENAQNLATIGDNLTRVTNKTSESVQKINNIIKLIRRIADQTKILGLNASIEAARAEEAGRGFGVVADEINRLSDESKESALNIDGFLMEISSAIEIINDHSQKTNLVCQEQASSIEEIAASVQELSAQLEILTAFSEHL